LLVANVAATYGFGWIGIAFCAVGWAWIRSRDAAVPLLAALAAAVSWGALLIIGAAQTREVAEVAGAAMQVGPLALILLTVVFPALVAGSLAGIVRGLRS
jgi:hypothetical protein